MGATVAVASAAGRVFGTAVADGVSQLSLVSVSLLPAARAENAGGGRDEGGTRRFRFRASLPQAAGETGRARVAGLRRRSGAGGDVSRGIRPGGAGAVWRGADGPVDRATRVRPA